MYSVPGGALCRQYSGNKLLSSPRQTRIYRWPSRTGLVYGSVPRYSLRSHPRKFTCPSISFAVITKASASRKLLACAHAAGSMTAGGVTNGACTIYMPRVRFLPPPPPPPFATDLLQRLPGVDVRLEDCLQGAKHTDMKAEKGVFSWNLPRLGIDLLLRPPHPAGRFLSPGSRVWGCFGAFPRRRFHLCFGRFSTRFELESNRDRKAGRIRPRRARPRRGPQPTITGNR